MSDEATIIAINLQRRRVKMGQAFFGGKEEIILATAYGQQSDLKSRNYGRWAGQPATSKQ